MPKISAITKNCYLFLNVLNFDTIIFLLQMASQNSTWRWRESVLFLCMVFLTKCFFFFFFLENPVCLELKMSIEEALLPAGCQTRKLDVVLTLPLSYATSLKLRYLASLFNIVSKNLELGKFWILPLFSTCLWFQHIYCDCKYGQCYHFHLQKYCHAKTSSWVS